MRAIKHNPRRRSLSSTVLLVLLALVVGVPAIGGGTIGILVALNMIKPAQLAFWRSKETPIPKDWVFVPMCPRPIPAYTKITRNDLLVPNTTKWAGVMLPPKLVPPGAITDFFRILGRVTAQDKAAQFCFREVDFLPPGSSPGVAGGTPSGKRAYCLNATELKGVVHDLRAGDHVDLLASILIDMSGAGHSNSGQMGSVVSDPLAMLPAKRTWGKPLVEDGVVVTPVRIRNVPITSSSLTQGTTTRSKPVEEIVIAVEPQEVAPLNEAVALKYEITCSARSGRPEPAPAAAARGKKKSPPSEPANVDRADPEMPAQNQKARDFTPGLDPRDGIQVMDVMIGAKRQFMLFNGPAKTPVVAAQDDGSTKSVPGVVPAVALEESKN
jgi:hypothetical protein